MGVNFDSKESREYERFIETELLDVHRGRKRDAKIIEEQRQKIRQLESEIISLKSRAKGRRIHG